MATLMQLGIRLYCQSDHATIARMGIRMAVMAWLYWQAALCSAWVLHVAADCGEDASKIQCHYGGVYRADEYGSHYGILNSTGSALVTCQLYYTIFNLFQHHGLSIDKIRQADA
ncbi:hypothetical protein [Spongiibacter tropicus]|uniref:hypothetical protein n=1 Tax=Spongiibacter tropicus TaxID=454602 RepID=UPI002357DB95|nr:hypothetical protein [Spongiibacter tropicus]|tara:strand:+ start:10635 stop:10976 length:342 start_codon:yes stop_codon:yes gene_type:complete